MTYTSSDVAKMFNVTKMTINNWVHKYNLEYEVTAGGHMRFTEENVEAIKQLIKSRWGV